MQRNCQTQIYCEDPIRHPKVASGQNWDRRTSQWRQVMSNSEVAPKLASSSWSRNQYRWSWHNTKKLISKRSYIQRFRRSKKIKLTWPEKKCGRTNSGIVEEMERIMMILDQEGGRVWHKKQKARVETWNYTYFCYASAPSFCYIWHGYYYTVLFILGVRN